MNLTENKLSLCCDCHSLYGGYRSWSCSAREILLSERIMQPQMEARINLENGLVSRREVPTYIINSIPVPD
jgi:hypothetical protein